MEKQLLDVLIVGAGPVGLFCANELTRHGLNCRIIDKKTTLSNKSKALGIHIRTLDVFKDCDFLDSFLEQGHKIVGALIKSKGRKIAEATFTDIGASCDFLIDLPQDKSERIFYQRLLKNGLSVEWQSELIAIEQDASSVLASVQGEDGNIEPIKASWIIACDGAHSTLRHLLKAEFLGAAYKQNWWLADLHIEWPQPENKMMIYVSDAGPLACFPMGDKRHRLVLTAPDKMTEPTLDDIIKGFNERSSDTAILSNPLWITAFSIHHRQIQQYRHNRIFFCGDAAHIHSPMGGQGLNTGIQDVYNLAWKLALVQKGLSPEQLLNSYHEERFPVGKSVLKKTDIMTRMILIKNNFLINLRNHLVRFLNSFDYLRKAMAKDLAELTISYAKSPIVQVEGKKTALKIGEYLPLVSLKSFKTGEIVALETIVKGTKHHLFIFVGKEGLDGIEKGFELNKYKDLVDIHVVTTDPLLLNTTFTSLWFDKNEVVHKQFSLHDSTAVLVRPDKYLGFIQSPINLSQLEIYLRRIFL